MTPPPATARRPATTAPAPRPDRRPPLRVVERGPGHRSRRAPRHRATLVLAAALVVGTLLAVVVSHALLAQGQVRLATVQAQLTAAQQAQHQEIVAVATLEAPSRVVAQAEQSLHMAPPAQIVQLPYVPLNVPLPPPSVAPAPAGTGSGGNPAGSGGG